MSTNKWSTHEAYLSGYLEWRDWEGCNGSLEEALAEYKDDCHGDGDEFTPEMAEAYSAGWREGKLICSLDEEVEALNEKAKSQS